MDGFKYFVTEIISLFMPICGESRYLCNYMVQTLNKTSLPTILNYFKPYDICNDGEAVLFYKLLPNASLVFLNDTCSDGKKSKGYLSVI